MPVRVQTVSTPTKPVPPELWDGVWACLRTAGCTECAVCRYLCPGLAITRDAEGRVAIDLDWSKGGDICAAFCPWGAVRMKAGP